MRRRRIIAALHGLLLASCVSAGSCPAPAGGVCDPRSEENPCPGGYHCARAELCTKRCAATEECLVPCTEDSVCRGGDVCTLGFCGASRNLVCEGGYCLDPSRPPDPYGPSDFGSSS